MNKLGSVLLSILLSSSLVTPIYAIEDNEEIEDDSIVEVQEEIIEEIPQTNHYHFDDVRIETSLDLPDKDTLYAGYVDSVFNTSVSDVANNYIAPSFENEAAYNFYDIAVLVADACANGEREAALQAVNSTEITYTCEDLGLDPNNFEFGDALKAIDAKLVEDIVNPLRQYLVVNCPYSLYWVDFTQKNQMFIGYSDIETAGYDFTIKGFGVGFYVASEYIGTASQYLDTNKTKVAVNARAYADKIVKDAQSTYSDAFDQLQYFKDRVCILVDYNYSTDQTTSKNPWEMIYVFDSNYTTSVVSDGYAKAFQYLCDAAGITCYLVDGYLFGQPHMWNIVSLDGSNYLVDCCECDDGRFGTWDELFMKGMTGSVQNGYSRLGGTYTYSENTLSIYPVSCLTLSSTGYLNDGSDQPPVIEEPEVELNSLLEGYSLSLDGCIGVKFYWTINEDTYNNPNAYISLNYKDVQTQYKIQSLSTASVDGKEYYVVPFYVSAKDMTEAITVQLVAGNESTDIYSFTVQDYADEIINHEEIYGSNAVNISKKMLTIGNLTQTYFGYRLNSLPTKYAVDTKLNLDNYAASITDTNTKINFVGANLVLEDTLSLKLYFTGNATFTVDGASVKTKTEGNYTVIEIKDIHSITKMYNVKTDNFSLRYSVASYGKRAKSLGKNDIVDLVQAYHNYLSLIY